MAQSPSKCLGLNPPWPLIIWLTLCKSVNLSAPHLGLLYKENNRGTDFTGVYESVN